MLISRPKASGQRHRKCGDEQLFNLTITNTNQITNLPFVPGYVESLPDCFVQEVTDDDFLADIRIGDAAASVKTTNLTIHKAVYTVPQNIRMKDWAMVMPNSILFS